MPSKYFTSRIKTSKKITPAGSSKVFNDPNIDERYKEVINQFQMSLIKSGEGLLNTFTATTVNSIPESILPVNDGITRLNDRIVPQSSAAPTPQVSPARNFYLEKINIIIRAIETKVKFGKSNRSSLINYFGKIDQISGTFYPAIIKYDAEDNPVYDMRVSIDNTIGETQIEVRTSHVP